MRQVIMSPKDKGGKRFDILCRGCSMHGREAVWRGYVNSIADPQNWEINNSYLTFEEEPNNKYDPNAVKVVCRGEFFGTVGYVGREFAEKVKDLLRSHARYRIEMLDNSEVGNKEIHLAVFYI